MVVHLNSSIYICEHNTLTAFSGCLLTTFFNLLSSFYYLLMPRIQQLTIILLMALITGIPVRGAPRDKQTMKRTAIVALSADGHHLNTSSGDIHGLRSTSAYANYGRDNGVFAIISADGRLPALLAVSGTVQASAKIAKIRIITTHN